MKKKLTESQLFRSKKFKQGMADQITKDTWGKGLPKIYMNGKGQIVEHWKDGTINILKETK